MTYEPGLLATQVGRDILTGMQKEGDGMGRASRKAAKNELKAGSRAAVAGAASRPSRGGALGAGGRVSTAASSLWGVPGLVLVGTLALLVYPPYFRALYFTREQLITFLITLVVFSLWWGYKWRVGDLRFFGSPLDYFALATALAWTLSIVVAVNPRGAIQEALKNFNYFLIYWLVAEQVRSKHSLLYRNPRPILGAMYLSALGVALVGLGAAAGVVHYNGAFVGGRISSTIQYPNSLAAYLTAAFYIGLSLWTAVPGPDEAPATPGLRQWWLRVRTGAFASSMAIILLTFIFTLSRGAWLVFPVALVILAVLAGAGHRLKAGAYFTAVLAAALAASAFMAKGISAQSPIYIGVAVLVTLVLGVGFGYLAEFYLRWSVRWKVALPVALVTVLAVVGGALFGVAATRPLALGHQAGEKDSGKAFEQGLSNLGPESEYVLTFDVSASGDAKKLYAWSATVYGFDTSTGNNKTLAQVTGKTTTGWERKQVKIAPSQGLTGITLQLGNYYSGTQVTFRDVTIRTDDGSVVAQPKFILAKALPGAFYHRLTDINLGTYSSESRLVSYSDALKMIREYPLFGMGGRGWASAFMKYQSYGYISRETHNHFLQTWVETGTIGLLAWLGLWGIFLYRGLRQLGRVSMAATDRVPWDSAARAVQAGVVAVVVAIGVHSLIDFNLSLPAVSFLLWSLMALTSSPLEGSGLGQEHRKKKMVPRAFVPEAVLPFALALAGILITGRLLLGYLDGAQAATLMRAGKAEQAQGEYQKAVANDPWTASFYIDLGQISRSVSLLQHGIALDPLNPQYHQVLGVLYLTQNKADEGLAELDESVSLEPFQQAVYQQVAQVDYGIGEGLLQVGQVDQANLFFQRVLDLQQLLIARSSRVPGMVPIEFRLNENSPPFSLVVGKAQALLGLRSDAIRALTNATQSKETANEAGLWLAAIYVAEKNPQKAAPFLAKVKAAGQQASDRYASVYQMLSRAVPG